MKTITMSGWKEGMKKIPLTHLQVTLLGLSLKDSKENVDKLLEDMDVVIEANSSETAQSFVREARKIGVVCQVVSYKVYKETKI
jgi:predicted dinucleotide-utilizing enzyme